MSRFEGSLNTSRSDLIEPGDDAHTAPFDLPAVKVECAAIVRLTRGALNSDLVAVRVTKRDCAFTIRAAVDPQTQAVSLVTAVDLDPDVHGLCDRVALGRQTSIVNRPGTDGSVTNLPWHQEQQTYATLIGAPLLSTNPDVIGALAVCWRSERVTTEQDVELIERMARLIVSEIEQAQTREAVAEAKDAAERQRAHYEHIFAAASDAIVTLSTEGTILTANPAAVDLFGHPLHKLVGRAYAEFVAQPANLSWTSAHEAGLDHGDRSFFPGMSARATVNKVNAIRSDGTRLQLETYEVPALHLDPPVVTVFHRDITDREAQVWRLERQATLLKLATAAAGGGHWTWVPAYNRFEASDAVREMLDRSSTSPSVTIEELFSAVHDDDRPTLQSAVHDAVRTGVIECEVRVRTRRGETRYVSLRGRRTDDADGRFVGFAKNVTAARTIDPLVGLPNQRGLIDTLEWAISRSHFEARALLVIHVGGMRDIDQVDTALADRAVGEIARRLNHLPGDHGGVFRLAGAGFAILAHDRATAQRALDALTVPFHDAGTDREFALRPCIGTASITEFGDPHSLLQAAKAACRAARQERVGAIVDHTDHSKRAERRLEVESRLRVALREGQVLPFYQPVIDLRTGATVGCEALARWRHHGSYVAPGEFIPLAEQTGLIHELGWMILESSCRAVAESERDVWVSVNVAAEQMQAPGFVERVLEVVSRNKLRPRQLKLEVTERTLVTNPDRIAGVLTALREGGVPICLDDFGTGYSSLSYLHRLPLDVVKIDRSFVDDLGIDPRDTRLVVAILQIARDLDLDVVAEGIETEQQRTFLHALGCRHGQGFLFARPMPVEEMFGGPTGRPRSPSVASPPTDPGLAPSRPVATRPAEVRPPETEPPGAAVRRRRSSNSSGFPSA